jgi:hypothetical protein
LKSQSKLDKFPVLEGGNVSADEKEVGKRGGMEE